MSLLTQYANMHAFSWWWSRWLWGNVFSAASARYRYFILLREKKDYECEQVWRIKLFQFSTDLGPRYKQATAVKTGLRFCIMSRKNSKGNFDDFSYQKNMANVLLKDGGTVQDCWRFAFKWIKLFSLTPAKKNSFTEQIKTKRNVFVHEKIHMAFAITLNYSNDIKQFFFCSFRYF